MKFEFDDAIDTRLRAVMAHEFILCQESFGLFTRYASLQIFGSSKKVTAVKLYSHYSRFLYHLYEFYIGAIKLNRKDTSHVHHKITDKILVDEVRKLYKNKVHAIEHGYAPSYENHISHYQVEIPECFGESFRRARNQTAHVSIERAASNFTLTDFYEQYHRFIFVLYETPMFAWHIDDIERQNWGDIERFSVLVGSK